MGTNTDQRTRGYIGTAGPEYVRQPADDIIAGLRPSDIQAAGLVVARVVVAYLKQRRNGVVREPAKVIGRALGDVALKAAEEWLNEEGLL